MTLIKEEEKEEELQRTTILLKCTLHMDGIYLLLISI